MPTPSDVCIDAPLYIPPFPQNGTGACMSLYTPQTLPLMTSCCPPSSVYIHNETATSTDGTEQCSYVVCDITGYRTWTETAKCLGRSVIVEGEDHDERHDGDGASPDSIRSCAFHDPGGAAQDGMSGARRGGIGWAGLVCGVLGVLMVVG